MTVYPPKEPKAFLLGVVPDNTTLNAMRKMSEFEWELKRTWLPRRCRTTGKPLRPLTAAYRGRRIIHGPGDDVILERWLSPEAYMLAILKDEI